MLANLIGSTNAAKLTDYLFPAGEPRSFGYIDCYCDGYLASAVAGGFFTLACSVLALAAGFLARTRPRISAFLAASWLAVQSGSFIQGYRGILNLSEFVSPDRRTERLPDLTRWLDNYVEGIAGQSVFNAVLLFAIPASLAYFVARKSKA